MADLDQQTIVDIIGALIADELTRLRKQPDTLWRSRQWHAEQQLSTKPQSNDDDSSIQVESLEWLAIASRVVEFFQIDSSGIEDYLLRSSKLGDWAEVVRKSRELGVKDITFSSSGSTGKPEKHSHLWHELVAEAEFFADLLGHNRDRVVSVVSPHHIYGFIFSALLPQVLSVPVVRGAKALFIASQQKLQRGDLVIGFPQWLEQLLQHNPSFPQGVAAVSSSGPAKQHVLSALEHAGINPITEIYGSSETGGIGFRQQRDGWYQLLPRWQRLATTRLQAHISGTEFDLPDTVTWHGNDQLKPLGRVDKAIQVNGYNVYPQRIAEILAMHPQVQDARVRLSADPGSNVLRALVVPDLTAPQSHLLLETELQQWLHDKLAPHEIPQQFAFADHVPLNALGKEQDWSLVAK
ncbi:4-coumarate--CoA ligase [Idiomarina tyrosinivorans]|uniref:4-coumarate--CoA ligase n=1 Tax=Idiomarina tyrosinivorans TaxID=1445662 RepID=A0A432ZS37_9GAMM|nr:AMP-binding protein [Idiomarina tyrosinivorans]RUO80735.1 4-coumarate--CoA ligase [Idiomarina tyrosinivorans]